jgi:transposase
VEEINAERKRNRNKNVEKRLKALELHAQGIKRAEIATLTSFSKTYISELVSKYCNNGIKAITENNYQGNHRNMSYEEESKLLAAFNKQAEQGQVIEVSTIKRAYEEAIGRSLENDHGIIYRLLKRHGWRKVMPRSEHPKKADKEAIEASKKLTVLSEKRWKILTLEKSD